MVVDNHHKYPSFEAKRGLSDLGMLFLNESTSIFNPIKHVWSVLITEFDEKNLLEIINTFILKKSSLNALTNLKGCQN